MTDLSLVAADVPFHSSIPFTYRRDDGSVTSWPDHFLCDPSLCSKLSLFCCLDFVSNLSYLYLVRFMLISAHVLLLHLLLHLLKPVLPGMQQHQISLFLIVVWFLRSYLYFLILLGTVVTLFALDTFLFWIASVINSLSAFMFQLFLLCPKFIRAPPLQAGTLVCGCSRRRLTFGIMSGGKLVFLLQVFFIGSNDLPNLDTNMK